MCSLYDGPRKFGSVYSKVKKSVTSDVRYLNASIRYSEDESRLIQTVKRIRQLNRYYLFASNG